MSRRRNVYTVCTGFSQRPLNRRQQPLGFFLHLAAYRVKLGACLLVFRCSPGNLVVVVLEPVFDGRRSRGDLAHAARGEFAVRAGRITGTGVDLSNTAKARIRALSRPGAALPSVQHHNPARINCFGINRIKVQGGRLHLVGVLGKQREQGIERSIRFMDVALAHLFLRIRVEPFP